VGADSPTPTAASWGGRSGVDPVTEQTRRTIVRRRDAVTVTGGARRCEVSHLLPSGVGVPIAYSAVRLGPTGPVVAAGRDLRAIAAIQQRFLDAQQELERDYWRQRQTEARYRLLFQVATDAVLVVDAATLTIIEANRAAAEKWVGACNRVLKEEVGSTLPELIPFVSRLCFAGFAYKKDDESSLASTHSSAFSVFVEFLLLHLRPSPLPADAPAEVSSSNKFVQDLLNKSSNRSVAEMYVQFVVDHVKTSKKRSGVECLKWDESNAPANMTLDLLKAAPEPANQAAAMYLNASITKGRSDNGHTLLLAELFASSGAKSKMEVLDSIGDKENAKATLASALTQGEWEEDVMDV
jgi:hypothetical protein